LKDGWNCGKQQEQSCDAGNIAQGLAQIEGVLPRDRKSDQQQQQPGDLPHA
jgi:hypothetical protein